MRELPAIIWHDEIDSTNSEARRHLTDLDNLSVIAACYQTAGRGQGDHTWTSVKGENLTFSVVLKYGPGQLHAKDSLLITQVTTLALRRLLLSKGIDADIKWPNDIYVMGRTKKICGILIENTMHGDDVTASIIGIGLDVNQTDFDPSLPNPVSMKQMTAKTYDTRVLLEEFQGQMADALGLMDSDQGRRTLEEEFRSRLFTLPSASR